MIRREFRSHVHGQRMAFIEACMEQLGGYRVRFLSETFGITPRVVTAIRNEYERLNPGVTEEVEGMGKGRGRTYRAAHHYERVVLKTTADSEIFLHCVLTLYGVKKLELDE